MKRELNRGSIKKRTGIFLGGWVDKGMAAKIDLMIKRHDLDRSKFLRAAIREKLARELATIEN